ncbi:piezo-type mechanosensitive ion channel component 2-like [Tachysurus ichikawai]
MKRTNQTLKAMISSFVKDNHRQWDRWMAEFRYAINTAWQESTGLTAEIALAHKLKGPLEGLIRNPPDHMAYSTVEMQRELFERVKEKTSQAQQRQAKYYNRRRKLESFEEGDLRSLVAYSPSVSGFRLRSS